jgi:hypothetical protein
MIYRDLFLAVDDFVDEFEVRGNSHSEWPSFIRK